MDELDNVPSTQWVYLLCSTAQKTTETPLIPLQLSIMILEFFKSINNDAEDIDQIALFNFLEEDGEAKKCDLDFLYNIQERGIQLRDDDDLSEETLVVAATIGDGSSSTTLPNTNTLATVTRFHCLSKRKYGRRQNSVTRVESHKNTSAKINAAPGVEENVPAQQFRGLSPELKKLRQKQVRQQLNEKQKIRGGKQKKQKTRTNEKKSLTKEASAQLAANKTQVTPIGHSERAYLSDTVTALLLLKKKELTHSAMVTDMPAEGDTSIFHIVNTLSGCGLSLEQVSGKYNRKGGVLSPSER